MDSGKYASIWRVVDCTSTARVAVISVERWYRTATLLDIHSPISGCIKSTALIMTRITCLRRRTSCADAPSPGDGGGVARLNDERRLQKDFCKRRGTRPGTTFEFSLIFVIQVKMLQKSSAVQWRLSNQGATSSSDGKNYNRLQWD